MPKKAAGKGAATKKKEKANPEDDPVFQSFVKTRTNFNQLCTASQLPPSDFTAITNFFSLEEPPKQLCIVSDCTIPALCNLMRAIPAQKYEYLSSISFLQMRFGDDGAQLLGDVIRACPKLETLDLSDCGLNASRMQPLTAALIKAPVPPLATLKVENNTELGVEGTKLLVRAMCLLPATLRTLHAANCGMGSEGAERLAMFVKSSKFCKLDTLKVDGNRFGEHGTRLLAEALALNQTIAHLSLAYNGFADLLTVRLLARAILLNQSLINVNIDGNSISDMGGAYLYEALKDTKRLQRLVVSPFMSSEVFQKIVDTFPNLAPPKKAGAKKKGGAKKGGKKKK